MSDNVKVITLDNPPVNALSFAYSAKLLDEVLAAEADRAVTTVIFTGANGLFSAGADINDFLTEPAPDAKNVRDVIAAIERGKKVYIAAIDGNCMGGGLELSLACDYRVATERSKLGLPEIKLGLLPGAGGTQRLPRLIGAQEALQMMLKGSTVKAADAKKSGLVDAVVPGDVVSSVTLSLSKGGNLREFAFGEKDVTQSERRLRTHQFFEEPRFTREAAFEGQFECGLHGVHQFVRGEAAVLFGRAHLVRLRDDERHGVGGQALEGDFFLGDAAFCRIVALRQAQGDKEMEPLEIRKAGVVGGGTMGTGIAITFANADIPVTVIEPNAEQIEKARQMVFGMFMYQVQKGRLTQEEAWKRGQSIVFTDDYSDLADADVVIEAVFENMDVKKEVFTKIDAVVKPEAILASNTSTLDIDEMAAVTKRRDKFVGLHFFAPANIMKLLEIVRGKDTSPQTLATAFKLGKTLRKVAVLSGNAFGFIGNRMLFDYAREAVGLAEEGVPPYRIDAVMKNFGFAMGPFAMFDLSGIDVFWHIQQARPDMGAARTKIVDRLYEQKRLGQKTGKGFYKYDPSVGKGREAIRDEEVEALFKEVAAEAGIAQNPDVSDEQIVERLTHALIDVGAELLEKQVALRPGDVDIVYIYGYGFPPHHGGPMWYGHETGYKDVYGGGSVQEKELVHA
jgi:3-hydroxyacyl-CoA dehydrogenase